MRVDCRTDPREITRKYAAFMHGQPVAYAVAADDVEGWVDIYVRRDANIGTAGFLIDQNGLVTARIHGPVEIRDVTALREALATTDEKFKEILEGNNG